MDTEAALVTLESGLLATMSWTPSHPWGYDVRMEIVDTKDCGVVGPRPPMRSLEENGADAPNNPYLGFLDRVRVTYENELDAFVSLASGGAAGVPTVRDALAAMLIAAGCDASRLEETAVSIEGFAVR